MDPKTGRKSIITIYTAHQSAKKGAQHENKQVFSRYRLCAGVTQPERYLSQAGESAFPFHAIREEVWITEAVLIEIGNALARSNRSAAAAFINSCYITGNVRVVTVDSLLLKRAIDFYNNREDKEWGLTDCISFIVMEDYGMTEALTTDEHFQQAGFHAQLLEEK